MNDETFVDDDELGDEDESATWGKKIFLIVSCVALISVIAAAGSALSQNFKYVASGVTAFGTSLEGMTEAEAEDFFSKIAHQKLTQKALIFTQGDKVWEISPESIGLTAQTKEAAAAAFAVGHGQNFWQNLKDQYYCYRYGRDITMSAVFDQGKLNEVLNGIAQELYVEPVSARVSMLADGSVRTYSGTVGKYLNTEPLPAVLAPPLTNLELPFRQALELTDRQPAVTNEDVAGIDSILASYTTSFYPGDRGDNIAIAAGHLDGVLVRSGADFSFNDTVGPRTGSTGYKNAGVIVEGRLEDDVGGGVCQVSSTLYNAVLLAGLTPTMRTSHFAPSTYCPPGRDATVADGLLDFQFKNQLPHSVYLVSRTYGGNLTLYVLGAKGDLNGKDIHLETEGSNMRPSVYRVYTRNGEVIEREFLHTDYYEELVTD